MFEPWIQRRRIAYAKHKRVIFGFLGLVKRRALGRLMKDDGEVDTDIVDKLVLVLS